MAETFDCPKCGAPMSYNSQEQGYKETMSCPYCGESVVIPVELRKTPEPQANNELNNLLDQELQALNAINRGYPAPQPVSIPSPTATARKAAGWSLASCLVTSFAITAVAAVIIFVVFISLGAGFTQFFNSASKTSKSSPSIAANIAPITPQPTDVPADTSTPAGTPTPPEDITATVQAQNQATLAAYNSLVLSQRNWPVVIQEKFANDNLSWTVGTDNNDLAIEDTRISGNKYTWKFTSKKSMGSFTYPTMPDLKDQFVSVDMQMTSSSQNADDQAGIIIRHSDVDKSFYFFGVNNTYGSYSLSMYDGSNWNDLVPTTQTALLQPHQLNHLAVSMQGNQILLMINNTVVGGIEDSQLSSGTAGLGLNLSAGGEDATVVFSNFSVRSPKK